MVTKTTHSKEVVRDADYYRRLGGYKGPSKLTAKQVGCPACQVRPDESCVNAKGEPMKGTHKARSEYANELNERANAVDANGKSTSTARWWRKQFRDGKVPQPPKPHGTFAAYQRHKRAGEDPCAECSAAAQEHWRKANQARSLAAAS